MISGNREENCMGGYMVPTVEAGSYRLQTERLGALPILNHFLGRLGLVDRLQGSLAVLETWPRVPTVSILGVVLRILCLRREPLYAVEEWAQPYDLNVLGLTDETEREHLNDDRVGRALTRLFLVDRATMLNDVALAMVKAFDIDCSQLHNDSSSITFHGGYPEATGRPRGGKPTSHITHGHNKDHRPDLKQLLWILTVSADGAVPLAYRLADGNTGDEATHIPTWDGLVQLVGRTDFLYVADSKLCTRPAMDHIDRHGGRFLTVLPQTRAEDDAFRQWLVTHTPPWTQVRRQPGRRHGDPEAIWWALAWPEPSQEGYQIHWFRSSQKIAHDAAQRTDRLRRAQTAIDELAARLASPRSRFRDPQAVADVVEEILGRTATAAFIHYTLTTQTEERFRQENRGRPKAETRYRRITRPRIHVRYDIDATAVQAEATSDGCFPLITNDRKLTSEELLTAYKYQPQLEQRHEELKGPMAVAPVFLQDNQRIEGLLCLEFMALLIRALIEREIRQAMAREHLSELSLYPEDRGCAAPTATRVLAIFDDLARHRLFEGDALVQSFPPELSPLQQQVLTLLDVPSSVYATL